MLLLHGPTSRWAGCARTRKQSEVGSTHDSPRLYTNSHLSEKMTVLPLGPHMPKKCVHITASEPALPIMLPLGHHLRAADTASAFRHKSGCKLDVLMPCFAISVMILS